LPESARKSPQSFPPAAISVTKTIASNFEPGSKAILVSESQPEKQRLPILSTKAGMQMDLSEETPKNASSPMQVNADPDSNSTRERLA
jgi:hypothetical protein